MEFLNPFTEKEKLDDKLAVVDVKARDQAGRLFNVEMQIIPPFHFPRRLLYNWAKIYSQRSPQEGDNYKLLRPTITICFVNAILFPTVPVHHLAFRLWEPEQAFSFCDDLAMHPSSCPSSHARQKKLATPLELWLYFLCHGATLGHGGPVGAVEPLAHPPGLGGIEDAQSGPNRTRTLPRHDLKAQRDAISLIL